MIEALSYIVGSVGGVAGLGAGAVFVWRAWGTRQDRRAARRQASAQDLDMAFSRMIQAAERQDIELARQDRQITGLAEENTEHRGRIEALEESNRALARENRTFREVLVGVMDRLRRKPPDTPESILAYILAHLPHFGKDQTP